ncbi:hypothetical protein HJFPF1_06509 [Paramyrothecium foliicola]|nr:hypothetical protein HJFPF1_06509 [Paramyrothecium foliicola]
MAESAAASSADGDASEPSTTSTGPPVVRIADEGDVVLDVTFETSSETLKRSRKAAAAAAAKKAGSRNPASTPAVALFAPRVTVAFRVELATLKKYSKYFDNLLSNSQFREAGLIAAAHDALAARSIKPAEADPQDLPWVPISDDDEATQTAGREPAFGDMLRIMHQKPPKTSLVTLSFVTTLAITADRFDCTAVIARALSSHLKFKWPVTTGSRTPSPESESSLAVEQVLRQKILVSWLLAQPLRLHHSTRELILRGSSLWSPFHEASPHMTAAWWNLPEGLEQELHYRRECIINTIASVQRHFLSLYASRERQCKLGYDSSAACDSFQLGQMLKFLTSKNLLFLVDFSAVSLDTVPDTSMIDVEELLRTLQQTPSYQIDKNHTNCGLRIRIDPIVTYVRTMLAANVISVSCADWKKRRAEVSWASAREDASRSKHSESKTFAFTRALANDQRLRYEGALYADQMARDLFTADAWDWTPEP